MKVLNLEKSGQDFDVADVFWSEVSFLWLKSRENIVAICVLLEKILNDKNLKISATTCAVLRRTFNSVTPESLIVFEPSPPAPIHPALPEVLPEVSLYAPVTVFSARPKTPNFLIASILLFISMGFFKKIRVDGGVFRWIKAVYCTVFSHCAGRFLDFFAFMLFYFLSDDQAVLSRFESQRFIESTLL